MEAGRSGSSPERQPPFVLLNYLLRRQRPQTFPDGLSRGGPEVLSIIVALASAVTMRVCVQRVSHASVALRDENDRIAGQIEKGFLVLLGVGREDDEEDARYLAKKVAQLRVFDDGEGKMNLDVSKVGGRVLVVSQFTLYADCVRGNRPSFVAAAPPEQALALYRFFVAELNERGVSTEEGVFQANMSVSLVNDGPVTIWIDSKDRKNA